MSATVKAHGMDGTLVEPDWPPLTLAEVRQVLAQFPALGEPLEISVRQPAARSPLRESSVPKMALSSSSAITAPCAMPKACLRNIASLSTCTNAGAQVPRVLSSASGQTAIEIGEWTYEVHETPASVDLYEEAISWTPFRTASHARAAGQALARLHLAAQGFDAPIRKPQPLVASFYDFLPRETHLWKLERYLAARPVLASNAAVRVDSKQALQLLAPFHAQLLPLLPALRPLWTHNDLHASNLFWSDRSDRRESNSDYRLRPRRPYECRPRSGQRH